MRNDGRTDNSNITVTAEPAQLSRVRRFVEEVAGETSLAEERIFDLKVAVSEACANAVEHSGDPTAEVSITASVGEDSITFEIADSGDFRLPPANFDTRRENRGLGLPLMVALMDKVNICRLPNGGTKVTLSARIKPGEKSAQTD